MMFVIFPIAFFTILFLSSQRITYFDGKFLITTTRNYTESITTTTNNNKLNLHLCRTTHGKYNCYGKEYDVFKTKLANFINNEHEKRPNWGKHTFPFPSNTYVLALGNSHMRQITGTFVCQYPYYKQLKVKSRDTTGREQHFEITYHNNATLVSITNHPFAYSTKWAEHLEQLIGRPLHTVDILIVGRFNEYKESKNTNFMKTMLKATSKIRDTDFEKVQPPVLVDFAQEFSCPIVHVSMFAQFAMGQYKKSLITIQELYNITNRTNIYPLSARKYIPILGECGATKTSHICHNMSPSNTTTYTWGDASSMHRCIGNGGGHSDLITWDIIDTIHATGNNNNSNNNDYR